MAYTTGTKYKAPVAPLPPVPTTKARVPPLPPVPTVTNTSSPVWDSGGAGYGDELDEYFRPDSQQSTENVNPDVWRGRAGTSSLWDQAVGGAQYLGGEMLEGGETLLDNVTSSISEVATPMSEVATPMSEVATGIANFASGGVPGIGSGGGGSNLGDMYRELEGKATGTLKDVLGEQIKLGGALAGHSEGTKAKGAAVASGYAGDMGRGERVLSGGDSSINYDPTQGGWRPTIDWQQSGGHADTLGKMKEMGVGDMIRDAVGVARGQTGGADPSTQMFEDYIARGPNRAAEEFYQAALTGEDPYFDRLSDKLAEQMQRSSAARGHFDSGRAQRMEGEAQADLAAERYKQMFNMSQAAQAAGTATDLAGADIASSAASAQQAANDLFVRAAQAGSNVEREFYQTLANDTLARDQQGLDWRTNLADQETRWRSTLAELDLTKSSREASLEQTRREALADFIRAGAAGEADILGDFWKTAEDQYREGMGLQSQALNNYAGGTLDAYMAPIFAAAMDQNASTEKWNQILGAGNLLLPYLLEKPEPDQGGGTAW